MLINLGLVLMSEIEGEFFSVSSQSPRLSVKKFSSRLDVRDWIGEILILVSKLKKWLSLTSDTMHWLGRLLGGVRQVIKVGEWREEALAGCCTSRTHQVGGITFFVGSILCFSIFSFIFVCFYIECRISKIHQLNEKLYWKSKPKPLSVQCPKPQPQPDTNNKSNRP